MLKVNDSKLIPTVGTSCERYVHFLSYVFISFFFLAPVEGLCCKPKYRANITHHFSFVFFLYFFLS